jgi:thioredoxin
MPEEVKTKADFDQCLKDNQKVVVDFTASWCGPCKMIGPKFAAMESEYPTLKFIKVDVDDNAETAEWAQIQAMPTFKCYIDGKEADTFTSADAAKLKAMLEKAK